MALIVFLVALLLGVSLDIPLIYLMFFGYACFFIQAVCSGFGIVEILKFSLLGAAQAKNILILFVLIGMLTGSWRICGTIPYIVYRSVELISPTFFVLSAFLLSMLLSVLIGTAFGTVSIMGSILMILSGLIGADGVMTAGAVLSGAYVGDRTSPMSSCARLVCDTTGTDYYDNIRGWIKSILWPLLLTIIAYAVFCRVAGAAVMDGSFLKVLPASFVFGPELLLPAALLLLLSLLKINVRLNMLLSVITAAILAVYVQQISLPELLQSMLYGYRPPDSAPQLLSNFAGGGLWSMLNAGIIVGVSSAYMGIFECTGMLGRIESFSAGLNRRIGRYETCLTAAVCTSALACNQTLAILLTKLFCGKNYDNAKDLAQDIVDTTVVISGIIPWSIACAVPLTIMQADKRAILFAFFCYLVPAVNWLVRRRSV